MNLAKLPAEIWSTIFSFACTDDGSTGRSLALVSRSIAQLSSPYMYQSLSICDSWNLGLFVCDILDEMYEKKLARDSKSTAETAESTSNSTQSPPLLIAPVPYANYTNIRYLFLALPATYTQDSDDSDASDIVDHGHFHKSSSYWSQIRDVLDANRMSLETLSLHLWIFRPSFWWPLDWLPDDDIGSVFRDAEPNEGMTEFPKLRQYTISGPFSKKGTQKNREHSLKITYPLVTQLVIGQRHKLLPDDFWDDLEIKFPNVRYLAVPHDDGDRVENDSDEEDSTSGSGQDSGRNDESDAGTAAPAASVVSIPTEPQVQPSGSRSLLDTLKGRFNRHSNLATFPPTIHEVIIDTEGNHCEHQEEGTCDSSEEPCVSHKAIEQLDGRVVIRKGGEITVDELEENWLNGAFWKGHHRREV